MKNKILIFWGFLPLFVPQLDQQGIALEGIPHTLKMQYPD